ncbi:hypothetical protein QYE76_029694 [Lolium multiflorum]|uniref:Uncharacterized protein n=1 Tax=Lolium multiflorum TaxID=4521 RepID=A0AAD8VI53_LOLMU|nr:hypothetical protein QYE76_029694 [Lolium multiflorum]
MLSSYTESGVVPTMTKITKEPRRPRMLLKIVMSKRKRLLKIAPSSRVGVGSRCLRPTELITDAKNKNVCAEEVKKLKQRLKDEQDAKRAVAAAIDKKPSESIRDLLGQRSVSRLYSMIFPKMKQDKTLDELAASFLVDPSGLWRY